MNIGDKMITPSGRIVKIISYSRSKIAGYIQYRNGKHQLADLRNLKPLTFTNYLKLL